MLIEIPDTTPLVPLARALAGLGITLQLHDSDPKFRATVSGGDCDLCGEWSGHLIGGACAPCLNRQTQQR